MSLELRLVLGAWVALLGVASAQTPGLILEPAFLRVDPGEPALLDVRRPGSSGHALELETALDRLPVVAQGTTPALIFETALGPGQAKARSEVRIRGADVAFADVPGDPTFCIQFDVFLPDASEHDPWPRERTYRGDWLIVWQCAQLGAAPPHYYRVTSPPLSLQVYGNPLAADTPRTRSRILFRRVAIGTDWSTVRFGGR